MQGQIKIEKIAIVTLLVLFIFYSLFEGYKILRGPVVEIISPTNYAEIDASTVTIEGRTKNISLITLNDRQIFINETGVFREQLLLPPGYTIIKVEASDRFKKTVTKSISLYRPYHTDNFHSLDTTKLPATNTASTSTSTKEIIN
jgi:hypothetical protein